MRTRIEMTPTASLDGLSQYDLTIMICGLEKWQNSVNVGDKSRSKAGELMTFLRHARIQLDKACRAHGQS